MSSKKRHSLHLVLLITLTFIVVSCDGSNLVKTRTGGKETATTGSLTNTSKETPGKLNAPTNPISTNQTSTEY